MKKFLEELLKQRNTLRVKVFCNGYDSKNHNSILGELVSLDEIGIVLKSSKEDFSKNNLPILIPFTAILKIEVIGV